jgi:hypothetical protein
LLQTPDAVEGDRDPLRPRLRHIVRQRRLGLDGGVRPARLHRHTLPLRYYRGVLRGARQPVGFVIPTLVYLVMPLPAAELNAAALLLPRQPGRTCQRPAFVFVRCLLGRLL